MTGPDIDQGQDRFPEGFLARDMDLADVEHVHALEQRLFPVDAWPLEMFLEEVSHPSRRYTVVLHGQDVVAYAGVMVAGETGDVQTVAVVPEHEGAGIGRALMRRMHRQARDMGATAMMLEVREDNPRARGLYESLGYESVHERPRYYRDGATAVIMRLALGEEQAPPEAAAPATDAAAEVPPRTSALGPVGAEAVRRTPRPTTAETREDPHHD